jgi:hypothetical protein
MINHAQPTLPSAAASNHGAASPSLELLEARQLRDSLRSLLRTEQAAMADFLVALADFDRLRGWEALGHASLFAFLRAELRLSNSSAFYRKSAARLLQDFPEVIEPLRDGRLCLSTIAELAKVLTEENRTVMAPRFFGLSAREAQELVAELLPRPAPPLRDLMTMVPCPAPRMRLEFSPPSAPLPAVPETRPSNADADSQSLLTSEVPPIHPARVEPRRDEIEPLTASMTRLHFNVRREVVKKVEAARRGLGHAVPNASLEQVLEAALDLLLEKQAKARGQVKRPRGVAAKAVVRVEEPPVNSSAPGRFEKEAGIAPSQSQEPLPPLALIPTEPPPPRRTGPRETIPSAVRRAVWARDQGRCTWPLDSGGVCGSTLRLELDHIVPWARWGDSTEPNLRLTCAAHNRLAARKTFGARCVGRYRTMSINGAPGPGPQSRGLEPSDGAASSLTVG